MTDSSHYSLYTPQVFPCGWRTEFLDEDQRCIYLVQQLQMTCNTSSQTFNILVKWSKLLRYRKLMTKMALQYLYLTTPNKKLHTKYNTSFPILRIYSPEQPTITQECRIRHIRADDCSIKSSIPPAFQWWKKVCLDVVCIIIFQGYWVLLDSSEWEELCKHW